MHRKILVVDDDPQILDLVRFFLEQAGFFVSVCKDGYGALDELYSSQYHLVILDINMPHMNGFKTLMRIRASAELRNIPVMMLTVSHGVNDVARAQKYNITDYIIKPPKREDLLKRVERVMGGLPQFEEIIFDKDEAIAQGSLKMPVFLKSISCHGMILVGEMPLKRLQCIELLHMELFQKLKIEKTSYMLKECKPNEEGGFDYFISFTNSSQSDQDKFRDWVISETYKKKSA